MSFGGEETETLCHQGVLHKGEVAPGQELSTSIWYTRWSSDLDLDCYFWCTEDGEVPQRPTDREEASDEIDKKVCFCLKKSIPFCKCYISLAVELLL